MTQDHTPRARMEKALLEYFQGEKSSGFTLMAWAFFCLIVAGFMLFKFDGNLVKGASAPIGMIALIQLTLGLTIFLRSNKLRERLITQLQELPEKFIVEEFRRMAFIEENLEKYKIAGQVLFFLGSGFVTGGAFLGGGEYMLGGGAGLCVQSAVTLVFDLFAGFRVGLYHHELRVFERER